MTNDPTNTRKIEHIRAFDADADIDRNARAFDAIGLTHRALPNIDLNAVDTQTTFLGKRLRFPLLISSMTGGNHDLVRTINANLAQAAEACQVAMAVGSQRVMFVDDSAKDSFALRDLAPTAVLLANLGAVQLNYGFDHQHCQSAVDSLHADGLYLHLNPLQEAVQPEGDVNFAGLNARIQAVVEHLSVPVLLKEVGCGLSAADIEAGLAMGIRYFDVAGAGGTSWSRIEYHRRQRDGDHLGLTFQDWGIPTPEALYMASQQLQASGQAATLIASGGLRNGIDMAKAVIMGAQLCGIAAPLLKPAMTSVEATITAIEQLHTEFKTAMFLLGVSDVDALIHNYSLIRTSPRSSHMRS